MNTARMTFRLAAICIVLSACGPSNDPDLGANLEALLNTSADPALRLNALNTQGGGTVPAKASCPDLSGTYERRLTPKSVERLKISQTGCEKISIRVGARATVTSLISSPAVCVDETRNNHLCSISTLDSSGFKREIKNRVIADSTDRNQMRIESIETLRKLPDGSIERTEERPNRKPVPLRSKRTYRLKKASS